MRVPASSANLGPGLRRARRRAVAPPRARGRGDRRVLRALRRRRACPTDRSNLCVRAFERAALRPTGSRSRSAPRSRSRRASGRARRRSWPASPRPTTCTSSTRRCSSWRAELEGHPDNVAAALCGGFVICPGPGEAPVRFEPPPGLEGVLAIAGPRGADGGGARRAAGRGADGGRGAQRRPRGAARARPSEGRLRPDRPRPRDRLHQPRRRALYPRSMELVGPRRGAGRGGRDDLGAGPTVLFWCHWQQTGTLVERLKAEAPDWRSGGPTFAPGRRGRARAVALRLRPGTVGRGERPASAGGVVVRDGRVLLVHRPRYDDWTFPKGSSTRASRSRTRRSARWRRRRACAAASGASCPSTRLRGERAARSSCATG